MRKPLTTLSTRRAVLRIGLRHKFGDLRENDDWRNGIQLRDESDWKVDMIKISIETDERYQQVVWNPMCVRAFSDMLSIPNEHELASRYARCQQEFGDRPAVKILSERPINTSNVGHLFQNP